MNITPEEGFGTAIYHYIEGTKTFPPEFSSESDKTTRGTKITLYLNEDSVEFANMYRAREVLDKY